MPRFLLVKALLLGVLLTTGSGCGTTKSRMATEQLLVSDAIDDAVADIDFRSLSGKKVFFDTRYVQDVKGMGFTNANYIISALRQQLLAADCRLQDSLEEADLVVEARVGTIGTDGTEIVYGMPANSGLATAATLVTNAPAIPTIPELSVARKNAQVGAAKIAVFAYDRLTRRPVWQSGIARSKSTAQDVWVFGAGPFQRGSIYNGTQFAGQRLRLPDLIRNDDGEPQSLVAYGDEHRFTRTAGQPPQLSRAPPASALPPALPDEEPLGGHWPLEPRIVSPLETELDWR